MHFDVSEGCSKGASPYSKYWAQQVLDEPSGDDVQIPSELFQLVKNALDPISRFANGISIAQSVMYKDVALTSHEASELSPFFQNVYNDKIEPIAKEHSRKITLWLDPSILNGSGYLNMDGELIETVLEEVTINALKNSEAEDTVSISVQFDQSSEHLHILVVNPARPTTRDRKGVMLSGLPRELE